MKPLFTAITEKEDDMYVSLCPELDIASQGKSSTEAQSNLKEAVELFFQFASKSEINKRLNKEYYITSLEFEVA